MKNNQELKESSGESPNDLKLSDRGGRRDSCEGSAEEKRPSNAAAPSEMNAPKPEIAGGVTPAPVRCSALLGDGSTLGSVPFTLENHWEGCRKAGQTFVAELPLKYEGWISLSGVPPHCHVRYISSVEKPHPL